MTQIKIKLLSLGYMPYSIDYRGIQNWKSDIFRVTNYDRIELLPNYKGDGWFYTDEELRAKMPPVAESQESFNLALLNSQLEDNFYVRRIQRNQIVISTFEVADILTGADIKIDNYILRMLYKYAAVYKRYGYIPQYGDRAILSHDETRACLFDMTPMKTDIVYSTERLSLCEGCQTKLKQGGVPIAFIDTLKNELKRVRKGTYYVLLDFVKRRPILAIFISLTSALVVNLISSILYDVILSFLGFSSTQ